MIKQLDLNRFGQIVRDPESGRPINIPAVYQMPPFWWEDEPEVYARIQQQRAERGLVVDDWDGGLQPTKAEPTEPLIDPQVKKWLEGEHSVPLVERNG